MIGRTEELLHILSLNPSGITADEAAKVTNSKLETVSSRLSKMALYGQVRRVKSREPGCRAIYFPISTAEQHP